MVATGATVGRRTLLTGALVVSTGCAADRSRPDALDPKDFGALGDGTRDDTQALGRCVATARSTGRPVDLRGRRYVVATLDADGATVLGSGATLVQPQAAGTAALVSVRGRGRLERVVLEPAPGSVGVKVAGAAGVRISSVRVLASGSHGCLVQRSRDVTLEDLTVRGSGGHGVVVQYVDTIRLHRVEASGSARSGIVIGGGDPVLPTTRQLLADGCMATSNGEHGLALDLTRRGGAGVPLPLDGVVRTSTCRGNALDGISVTCTADLLLERNTVLGNGRNGIGVASARVTVLDNRVTGNGRHGIALFGGDARPLYGQHVLGGNTTNGNRMSDVLVASPRLVGQDAGD